MTSFYDDIDIEDMRFDPEKQVFHFHSQQNQKLPAFFFSFPLRSPPPSRSHTRAAVHIPLSMRRQVSNHSGRPRGRRGGLPPTTNACFMQLQHCRLPHPPPPSRLRSPDAHRVPSSSASCLFISPLTSPPQRFSLFYPAHLTIRLQL